MGRVRRKQKACRTRERLTEEEPSATDIGSGVLAADGYHINVCDAQFVESYERLLAAEDAGRDVVSVRNFDIVSPAGAVLVAGIGISAALMTWAVPRFAELYEAFSLTLPLSTRALIAASAWLASGWGWFGLAVIAYVCVRVTRGVRDSSPAMIAIGLALLALTYSLFAPMPG